MGLLADNFTLKSPVFRRSIRTAVAITIAVYIAELLGFVKGYWLPMTTLIVMEVTVGGALRKGWHRMLGTLVGVVIATGILLANINLFWLQFIFLIALFFAYYLKSYNVNNYGFVAFTVTVMILILFQLVMPHAEVYFLPRLYETVIGACFGMLMSIIILPTRSMTLQKETLTKLIGKYKEFFQYQFAALVQKKNAYVCILADAKTEILEMLVVNRVLLRVLRYESFINPRHMRVRANAVFSLERIDHLALSIDANVSQLFMHKLSDSLINDISLLNDDIQFAFELMLEHIKHQKRDETAINKNTLNHLRDFTKNIEALTPENEATINWLNSLAYDLKDLVKILRKLDEYVIKST